MLLALPGGAACAQPQPGAIESVLPPALASAPLSELATRARAAAPRARRAVFYLRMVRPEPRARAALAAPTADAGHNGVPDNPAVPGMPRVSTGGTVLNFDGVGAGTAAPANVNAAVGETQYVQAVNDQIAVYRKRDGALLLGPIDSNAVFAAFGGSAGAEACRRSAQGSPIVQYDKAARRWIVSQTAAGAGAVLYQCIAVSRSPDATGSYWRYALALRGAGQAALAGEAFRLAVWPDAYYLSLVTFDPAGDAYRGARVCALGRAALLAGARAVVRCRDLGPAFGPALAADLDGAGAPPRDSPNYLIALDFGADGRGEHLILWRHSFTRDTLGAPVRIPVAPFTIACPGSMGGACIEQAGAERLGALGDRLMPRLAYRNFGKRASLVVNHSVQQPGAARDGPVGVRWYELRDEAGALALYQQGTHAPDANSRWMGSIAMDRMGNIALGYSVAGGATPAGVRYTGRLRTQAPGRLEREEVVVNGTGVQHGAAGRWGDQSAMTLDPVDDCTFWYTQQYIPTTGRFTWRTRIANFTFNNCRAGPPAPPGR
ncbi:hypothetical protein C7C56_010350 [Massilia glaciei]|uniref:Uncharacterized protein n=1 Tax=Massilia glaciei TaxID=1524097 RepID=A0A2U2HMF6_9BURK|nr:hypothetical protein C7C56_010350 [Massilia glaciei]